MDNRLHDNKSHAHNRSVSGHIYILEGNVQIFLFPFISIIFLESKSDKYTIYLKIIQMQTINHTQITAINFH